MLDTERFKFRTQTLREILEELKPKEAEFAIRTYNFIIQTCEHHNNNVAQGLENMFKPFSKTVSPEEMPSLIEEAKTAALTWKLLNKHDPAFMIIHGFNSNPDFDYKKFVGQYKHDPAIVGKSYLNNAVLKRLETLAYEDGAILIDAQKNVVATNAHIIHLDSQELIARHYPESVIPGFSPDSAGYYGFHQNVNTRHLSALYASFQLPGVVIYTLGERIETKTDGKILSVEDGHIRRYQNGLITFSTLDSEADTVARSIAILRQKAA